MGNNLRTKFVGMDVHQKSISIAIADDGPDGEVRLYGTKKKIVEAIDKETPKNCIYTLSFNLATGFIKNNLIQSTFTYTPNTNIL